LSSDPSATTFCRVVNGISAYCGNLWLAALRAAEETARTLGDNDAATNYHQMFAKAQKTYIDKLWNGQYFLQPKQ
jgi:non-lysosomal glucosylceramidase